jgi:hypothetical protein
MSADLKQAGKKIYVGDMEIDLDTMKKLREKHPTKVPVIAFAHGFTISNQKYLVGVDISVMQFISIIRKHIKGTIKNKEIISIVPFVNNVLLPSNRSFGEVFDEAQKQGRDFLEVHVYMENAFG